MRHLGDDGERTARAFVASLGMRAGAGAGAGERPRVVADMVATVDGRASVNGRSVGLGNDADRAVLRELRAEADAILVGTGTLAAEKYANLLDDEARERRVAEGRPPHPFLVTISRRLRLPVDEAPVFGEEGVNILAFAETDAPPPSVAADLTVVRLPAPLSIAAVLADLHARGVRGVLCEGGPSLLRQLVAEELLDDLCLTVSPLLAAGDAPTILEGAALPDPARLTLRDVHRADEHVFLHYGLTP